jgi:hypothetical protein
MSSSENYLTNYLAVVISILFGNKAHGHIWQNNKSCPVWFHFFGTHFSEKRDFLIS